MFSHHHTYFNSRCAEAPGKSLLSPPFGCGIRGLMINSFLRISSYEDPFDFTLACKQAISFNNFSERTGATIK